ncbi:hypothetical protein TIFTF001_032544 [Ficus carica]|uniref:Uncharacterized protein n=1 Tax=Ficus carica TaxID=3494 RepID=A0AA88DWV7_FICCA|nr:hypothetical protein TIFTF001_032544 [Ficus carica]
MMGQISPEQPQIRVPAKLKLTLQPKTPAQRFAGECVQAAGLIYLPITIGDGLGKTTQIVEFFVVDKSSVYNVILGRPTLNTLKAVVSTYHLLTESRFSRRTRRGLGNATSKQ